ncbi:hypothetical protein [Phenylobacterium sp.]|uniref:hypothetical protein n=1 Tax=Phenylobacterium sp. TaxID=1871053 RepID=UPI0025F9D0E5|nr:hypothetical protein [Phenylobacterium sp.]
MRISTVIGAALAVGVLAAGGPGAAEEAPAGGETLRLVCMGSDTMLMAMTPYYRSGRTSYSGGMYFGEGRQPAQLELRVDGGKAQVKPPQGSVPMFARGDKEGWYELSDVAVDRFAIKGRMKWNRLDRSALAVDRRTGAVTFGSFSGVCQRGAANPDATKF